MPHETDPPPPEPPGVERDAGSTPESGTLPAPHSTLHDPGAPEFLLPLPGDWSDAPPAVEPAAPEVIVVYAPRPTAVIAVQLAVLLLAGLVAGIILGGDFVDFVEAGIEYVPFA